MNHSKPLFEAVLEMPRPYLLPVAALLAMLPLFVYIASFYVKGLPAGVAALAAVAGWPVALFTTIQVLPNGRS